MLSHLIVILFFSSSCMSFEVLNLPEGSPCTHNHATGRCVSIYDCLSSYIDEGIRNNAQICSLRGKEPILCCTDCTFNDTRNLVVNPNEGIIHKTGKKAQDKCIDYVHRLDYYCKRYSNATMTRVYKPDTKCHEVKINIKKTPKGGGLAIGGRNALRDEYPHMALLGYGDDDKTNNWICGGSVISERFILTAGHCLFSPDSGPVNYATVGILQRSDPPELWQIYNAKRRIPHPEYKSPSKYHDIALIETDTEIIFSEQVLPACLHSTGEADFSTAALGWGALGYKKELADTLQTVPVSPYKKDECLNFYSPGRNLENGYNHTTQMCYGDSVKLRDTCEGDSGGPLQNEFSTDSNLLFCKFTIIGVTSFGKKCGIVQRPGIYTRVIYYVPWIESIVWP